MSTYQLLPVKDLLKLEKRSFRDEQGVFLIEGKKVFQEAREAKLVMEQILVSEKFMRENREFLAALNLNFRDFTIISDYNAGRMAETTTPTGLFAVIKKPTVTLADVSQANQIVVLEDIRDPGNLGTMIRTADWFGIKAIILTSTGVDTYNSKVIRATMGSLFHLKIYVAERLLSDLNELKKQGFQMVVTRPETKSTLQSIKVAKRCFIFGNESAGTSPEVDEIADAVFSIPKYGPAESLNVSVAFGITLHELSK